MSIWIAGKHNQTKSGETQLPAKNEFYRNLTMEGIADADYKHPERVWENFKKQNLGQNDDL